MAKRQTKKTRAAARGRAKPRAAARPKSVTITSARTHQPIKLAVKDRRITRRPQPVELPRHDEPIGQVRAGESRSSVYPIPYEKNRVGRPTKYKDEFAGMLVEHMAGGNPFETFAARVHTSIATIKNWLTSQPEFLAAKKLGEPKQLAWWLRLGKAIVLDDPQTQLRMMESGPFVKKHVVTHYPGGLYGMSERTEETIEYHTPRGNTGTYAHMMMNLFRGLGWRNDYRVEHTGLGGGPIQTEGKSLSVSVLAQLPTEQLQQLEAILANAEALRVEAQPQEAD